MTPFNEKRFHEIELQPISETIIPFWKSDASYGYLSNWAHASFEIPSIGESAQNRMLRVSSSEQAFMYYKAILFNDSVIAEKILHPKISQNRIKKLGREVQNFDQQIWDANKDRIMYWANYAKYAQNKQLLRQLLSTGKQTIIEASALDTIWGVGLGPDSKKLFEKSTWQGENHLGHVLMLVRETLRNETR